MLKQLCVVCADFTLNERNSHDFHQMIESASASAASRVPRQAACKDEMLFQVFNQSE